MLSTMLIFIKVYMLLFGSGLGLSYWLSKPYPNKFLFAITASPVVGYALLATLSIYPLHYGFGNNALIYLSITLIGSSILASAYYVYSHGIQLQPYGFNIRQLPFWLFFTLLVIFFYLHNYDQGILYHYINSDIIGYTSSANWIASYGNFNPTESAAHEVLVSALRWGLPSCLAIVRLITNTSVYGVIFPVVFIVFFHSISLMSMLMINVYCRSSTRLRQIIPICILLNGSLLYFLSEGFYPYILGIGYFSILAALTQYRVEAFSKWPFIGLTTLILSTLITTCSEIFCLSVALIIGVIVISLAFKKNTKAQQYCLIAVFFGIALVQPLSLKLIAFTLANCANANHIGYPQPTWVWPSEILGLMNIYSHTNLYLNSDLAVHIVPRSDVNFLCSLSLSLWVLYELLKWRKNNLFIVATLGVIGLCIINLLLLKYHDYSPYNYLYDKLAISFSPIFITFFFIGLMQSKRCSYIKTIIAAVLVITSSILFFNDKKYSKSFIDTSALQNIKKINWPNPHTVFLSGPRGFRSGSIELRWRYVDRTSDILINTILEDRLLDSWNSKSWDSLPDDAEVFLIANKAHMPKLIGYKADLDTRSYYVVNTNKTLAELKKGDRQANLRKIYEVYGTGP